jgi:CpcD/allophycocyanin linker domain
MILTNISNLSEDAGRTFEIEVTGSPHQARLRTSGYKVKVPYSALSTTISSIGQRGGKIVSVKMLSLTAAEVVASSPDLSSPTATEVVASSPEQHESQLPVAIESADPIVEAKVVQTTNKSHSKAFVPAQTKNSKSKKR